MPIYEFKCKQCGHTFSELFHTSNVNVDEVECPSCHATSPGRLLSVFATDSQGADVAVGAGAPCGPHCACHG